MKKIALLLAMLLCLVPVLSACGANSSPEKLVEAVVEATYEDFDYEAIYSAYYDLDIDLLEEVLDGKEELDSFKESARSTQDQIKENFKNSEKAMDKMDDYDVSYEIRYCEVYGEDDDWFDTIMKGSGLNDTEFDDLIDEVAKVKVVGEIFATDEDGNETITDIDKTYTCYCIDGDWYLGEYLGIGSTDINDYLDDYLSGILG